MKRILQALHAVDGVQGSLVIEGQGQILAYQAHPLYDINLLEMVSQTIVSAVDSVQLLHEDWETLNANFADGSVILRNIKPGGAAAGRTFVLGLIADNRLNPSFALVAMRVAASKLKHILESPNTASDVVGSNPNLVGSYPNLAGSHPTGVTVPAGMAPPIPQSNAQMVKPASPIVASSGLSWSGLGSSGRGTTDVAVADNESSAFLTLSTKTLGASVGPMAKVFVKEAVRKLCTGSPFSRTHWEPLIAELRKHIEDDEEAVQFQKKLRARF